MSEYSYENIIINPNKEGIESLIGKEVYFHNNPSLCLDYANKKTTDHLGVLVKILKNSPIPFTIKQGDTVNEYSCIIEKKEEPKPEYVPFETLDEFIESYKKVEERINYSKAEDYIASCGMWLKDKDRDVYCLVTEIWNYGVVVGDSRLNTTKDGDGYFTINEVTKWKQLFREYTFMDDSPCGKEVEE